MNTSDKDGLNLRTKYHVIGDLPMHLLDDNCFQRFGIHYLPLYECSDKIHTSPKLYIKSAILYSHRDAFLLFQNEGRLLSFCALKYILPFLRFKLIAIDFISLRPLSFKARFKARIKKLLLKKVDIFILHVKKSSGYRKHLGIDQNRIRYIPYIVKQWDKVRQIHGVEEKYILSCGQSRRDYRTFIEAVRRLPYPVKILAPQDVHLSYHRSDLLNEAGTIPPNVEVIHDDGTYESWLNIMAKCRILVVPINQSSMYAEGVGSFLTAMALRKCVIITETDAATGIIDEGQSVLVPPRDPDALQKAIAEAWEDDTYRNQIASKGYEHALSVGGERELLERMLEATVELLEKG